MQTHDDADARREFLDRLRDKANRMTAAGTNQITAGKAEEKPLAEWKFGGVFVRHMPDDEHGVLRISAGGGDHTPVPLNYCTIRGSVGDCIQLLEKAIVALRAAP